MAIDRLLEIASDALAEPRELQEPPGYVTEERWAELGDLLRRRNGFYAFESALHVPHAGPGGQEAWNSPTGWKAEWDGAWDDCWCFGEDVFGSQFALAGDEVVLADAETARREPVAGSLADWAERVLEDYDYLCGYPLARDWQERHGPLPPGKRLFPKTPFMLGGDFTVDNLGAVAAEEAMRARGEIFRQVRDLPPGAKVRLKTID